MPGVYYNDVDGGACSWLRELVRAGELAEGDVDERSICDVRPGELAGYTRCHFFAGIGGWEYALRLAGWPGDVPVWTGSCPCQPFSNAGKRKGTADERHLWPEFYRLIRECRPPVVFGEQVEGAVRLGWLDGVFADLEAEGYACGASVLGAHSVGAPHIRQRLYWVAYSGSALRQWGQGEFKPAIQSAFERHKKAANHQRGGAAGGLADAQLQRAGLREFGEQGQASEDGRDRPAIDGPTGRLADANGGQSRNRGLQPSRQHGQQPQDGGVGFWSRYDLIPCRDGKARRVESGSFPLVDGFPGRVGLLRGYGNAIVPQVAAEFIAAFMDVVF